MQSFITKELLENCIVELSENYNIGYSYSALGIHISVAKIENGVMTLILEDFIPYPSPDEIGY